MVLVDALCAERRSRRDRPHPCCERFQPCTLGCGSSSDPCRRTRCGSTRPRSGWSTGASGASASSGSRTAGSSSYSTSTQARGFLGGFAGFGGDRRDPVADEPHAVVREDRPVDRAGGRTARCPMSAAVSTALARPGTAFAARGVDAHDLARGRTGSWRTRPTACSADARRPCTSSGRSPCRGRRRGFRYRRKGRPQAGRASSSRRTYPIAHQERGADFPRRGPAPPAPDAVQQEPPGRRGTSRGTEGGMTWPSR